MGTDEMTRRDFVKTVAAGSVYLGAASVLAVEAPSSYDPKGLPTRKLGRTGVNVPAIGLGGGSRFCRIKTADAAEKLLNEALDNGLYYWDTAHDYVFDDVVSEERYGRVLKTRRNEVFLATKVGARNVEEAKRHLDESLNRLQTDRLDIYQIHLVRNMQDVDQIGARGGLYEWMQRLKEQKVTRFIGFTGHLSAVAMKAMVDRYEFDTMLVALNHYQGGRQKFEEEVVPAAAEKGLGVMVMKVVRPRETVKEIPVEKLIRYALTLRHVDAAVVGMDSLDILRKNLRLLRTFQPLKEEEMESLRVSLAPFYDSDDLPWMDPNYLDGKPA